MGVTVRCQVFSGRRDPVWTLSPTQLRELRAMIDALTGRTLLKPTAVAGALGYRGFQIHSDDVEEALTPESLVIVHDGIIDQQRIALNLVDENNRVERWLLNTAGSAIDPDLKIRIEKQMRFTPPVLPPGWQPPQTTRFKKKGKKKKKPTKRALCRPDYNPQKWNGSAHVGTNHCYNYATDVMTDNAALPGEGSGTGCCVTDASVTCGKVGAKAALDGLTAAATVTPANPPHAHFVALAVEPSGTLGRDFHWYRRDCNGFWSHKVGNSPARNVDESGQPIADPQTCDRGTYSVFCGFFVCDPSIVTIL